MKKTTLGLAAVAMMASAWAAPYRQLHRIFAAEADKIEAARRAYPDAFKDGVIIATFAGLTIGKPEVRDFARQKEFVERFKARGEEVQICISSTIGHMDGWTARQGYPKMVGPDGKAAQAIACPRSAAFADYLRALFRRYAELGPSVIWVDDDFRMMNHSPVGHGCFCDACRKRFAAETGLSLDRKTLVAAILSDACPGGVRVRQAWRDYNSRALTEVARTVAQAVHAVDDGIVIGFMITNIEGQGYGPPDFPAIIAASKNRADEVWFRHGSGVYTDFTPYAHDGVVMKNISIGRMCAVTEGPGIVNLTEEVTCPYVRRAKSMRMTFLELALNVAFAGADGTTYDAIKPNLDEQLRDDAVVAAMGRRYREVERMHALVRGKRQIGIYPFYSPDVWLENGKVDSLWKLGSLDAEAWWPLVYLGVPVTFREKDASLLLLAGRSVRAMPKGKLEGWLARGVLADGTSAMEIKRRFPDDMLRADRKLEVHGSGTWSTEVWGRKAGLAVKDGLDRLSGGRMPSRVDTVVRLAQSVWETPDRSERAIFLFNLDFDDATDVRLTEDGVYSAELLHANGIWSALGAGDTFAVPPVPAWSVAALRLRKIRREDCP